MGRHNQKLQSYRARQAEIARAARAHAAQKEVDADTAKDADAPKKLNPFDRIRAKLDADRAARKP